MRAVAYLRVSSRAQTLAMQRSAVQRAATARGDNIEDWYADSTSGRSIDRAELARLRLDVQAGRVKRIYVFRLDRLARSGIRDTFEVIEELRQHGCELVTVADGFDLNGPAADVILAVLAWSAQMERLAINERISAARDRLELQGRSWGRPRRLSADQVQQAARLRSQGRSLRQIAIAMKVPRATLQRALARP